MASDRRSSAQTREHVLDVTHELFYWRGIHATGVDAVASAAEVAPTTLYRLFGSKDGLIAAYVERAADLYKEWFEDSLGSPELPARKRLLDLFSALDEQVQPENCRGCPFLMALAEIPHADHEAHRHAVAVKRWVNERFGEPRPAGRRTDARLRGDLRKRPSHGRRRAGPAQPGDRRDHAPVRGCAHGA